jgi:hypothetical protein
MWCNQLSSTYRRNIMSMNSHLEALKKKHETLSEHVATLQRSPASDDIEVAKLKKQKLILKEEISRLSTH